MIDFPCTTSDTNHLCPFFLSNLSSDGTNRAGAVGSIAGQIAQKEGAKVIGIAGGARKINHLLNDLNFEAAIDYKSEDVRARLAEVAPNGVNGFFDNVGGDILEYRLPRYRKNR